MLFALACVTVDPVVFQARQARMGELSEERWGYYRAQLVSYMKIPTPPDYQQQIEARLGRTLKDPLSLQLKLAPPKGGLVCGEYNAKNSYGGYVGFRPFGALFNLTGQIEFFNTFEVYEHLGGAETYWSLTPDDAVAALGCSPTPRVRLPNTVEAELRAQVFAEEEGGRTPKPPAEGGGRTSKAPTLLQRPGL